MFQSIYDSLEQFLLFFNRVASRGRLACISGLSGGPSLYNMKEAGV
jgi:hypothetical protein